MARALAMFGSGNTSPATSAPMRIGITLKLPVVSEYTVA